MEHGWKGPSSSLHSKVAPALSELNVKTTEAADRLGGAESIKVSGGGWGPVLTVQLYSAGVGSVLPRASLARTRKVW